MAGQDRSAQSMLLSSTISGLFLICAVATIFAAFHIEPTDARCNRLTYPWSPMMDIVKYRWETFENHQFSIKTPYFGFEPTDELEETWNALLPEHPIAIPSSRLESLGQIDAADDAAWIRNPQNKDSVLALPEYAVQLGCLNFLRQLGYRSDHNFSHLRSFQGDDSIIWERAYQCIERLRHAIMCWADVGPITLFYNDHPTTVEGYVRDVSFDFGTLHYCRNFDAINEWTKDNAVTEVKMNNLWWGGSSAEERV